MEKLPVHIMIYLSSISENRVVRHSFESVSGMHRYTSHRFIVTNQQCNSRIAFRATAGTLNFIDNIWRYFVSSANKTCLSRVVEGKGPAKPQQPVTMTPGAKSCRKAKMRGVLCR
jgi:hypothetical protein